MKIRNHFPGDWSEEKISGCISQIVNDPNIVRVNITGKKGWILYDRRKVILDAECCGIKIRVILEPEGRGVLAAYPLAPEENISSRL